MEGRFFRAALCKDFDSRRVCTGSGQARKLARKVRPMGRRCLEGVPVDYCCSWPSVLQVPLTGGNAIGVLPLGASLRWPGVAKRNADQQGLGLLVLLV